MTSAKLLPATLLAALFVASSAPAQPKGPKGPVFVSPEVAADRTVTFRLHAPKAEAVGLVSSDLPGGGPRTLKKGDNGVWELAVNQVQPGTFR